ncbi:MAG: peptide chain release factor N(5)-glutamine methyltransferase [Bacteroidales bacterium]
MKPGELQKYFIDKLIGYYNEREIRSVFFQMLEHYFHLDRIQFFNQHEHEYSPKDLRKIRNIVKQLQEYKPIQYIIGNSFFYGLNFYVSDSVLIPRPETEELVDLILQRMQSEKNKEFNILDIGTGSGCLAVSLGANLKNNKIWACDISEAALKIAENNAAKNQVKVQLFQTDILQQTLPDHLPLMDIIVSNPPYVLESEKSQMKPNVLLYEPEAALFVPDENPLLFYRVIAEKANPQLKAQGRLFFEINEAFGGEMVKMLESLKYRNIIVWNDIHGKDRFVEAMA